MECLEGDVCLSVYTEVHIKKNSPNTLSSLSWLTGSFIVPFQEPVEAGVGDWQKSVDNPATDGKCDSSR